MRNEKHYVVKDTYHEDRIIVKDSSSGDFRDCKVLDAAIFGHGRTDREAIQNMINGLRMDADRFQKYLDNSFDSA
jgi:hypothetical protein